MSKNNDKAKDTVETNVGVVDIKAKEVVDVVCLFKNTSGKTIMFSGEKIMANQHIEGTVENFAELIKKNLITKISADRVLTPKKETKDKTEAMVY